MYGWGAVILLCLQSETFMGIDLKSKGRCCGNVTVGPNSNGDFRHSYSLRIPSFKGNCNSASFSEKRNNGLPISTRIPRVKHL